MRHIVPLPSSVKRRAPSCATATPHRPAPDILFVDHKSGQKIIVLARRHPVVQPDAHDLVAGARATVPGSVLSRKGLPAIFLGKQRRALGRVVKTHFQRRRMRLQEHIGDNGFTGQIGTFSRA